MNKRNQYYSHYTDVPAGYIGLEFYGTRQWDRALSLIGSDEDRYFLDQRSFHKFLLWMPQDEIRTTGEWVRTGKGKKA